MQKPTKTLALRRLAHSLLPPWARSAKCLAERLYRHIERCSDLKVLSLLDEKSAREQAADAVKKWDSEENLCY